MADNLYLTLILSLFLAAALSTTTVKAHIEGVFGTSSPMVDVAICESSLRQFDAPNHVLRGEITPADTGVFQISVDYHGDEAKTLGFDIYSLDGNIAFAKYLYDKNGLKDWSASKKCIEKLQAEG